MTDKHTSARREASDTGRETWLVPQVDIHEDDSGLTLLADLPGVPKDRLTLRVEGDALHIEGELAVDAPADLSSVLAEVQVPRYRRSFTLSRELDSAGIQAALNDGVLRLRIPKLADAQPRRIDIQVA
ncbi:Hsp20/alpha crystallin family protein [Corticimicrobacter populi]|uniref:Heat-shock protein n=1 Tax=Corticimicrobacter populi TaxID=2175229 RepID=A0A2V1K0R8_9BURK|nr:Hsp20/alpha crystallin family protein [Corticimicrobacter populi]PWF24711.1 heat-shock protein [Corticimicrobacter populi]